MFALTLCNQPKELRDLPRVNGVYPCGSILHYDLVNAGGDFPLLCRGKNPPVSGKPILNEGYYGPQSLGIDAGSV